MQIPTRQFKKRIKNSIVDFKVVRRNLEKKKLLVEKVKWVHKDQTLQRMYIYLQAVALSMYSHYKESPGHALSRI